MPEPNVKLPGMERVNVVGGRYTTLMEVADPIPFWYVERLQIEDLSKLISVGLKYQGKLIDVEMERLKIQSEAIGEMQKVIQGFK